MLFRSETIIISASESLGDYTNDASTDEERLIVVLPNGTNETGDYSVGSPQVTIKLETLGSYNIRIYLQDENNDDDLTEYIDYTVSVSDNAVACNPSGVGSQTSDVEASGDEELSDQIDELLGGMGFNVTSTLKLIFFTIISVIVLIGLGTQMTHMNPSVAMMTQGTVAVMLFVFGVFLGFIPVWIMVVGVFAMIAFAIYLIFGRGGD